MAATAISAGTPVSSAGTPPRRQRRRDFLIRTAGGAAAAGALAAFPLRSRAAETVNIGALYPVTGSFAQIGQGCVNATPPSPARRPTA